MQVGVEFTGIPRVVTGEKQVSLELKDGTTFREIVRLLGIRYPKMIGEVLQPDGETLQPSTKLNLNGRRMIQPAQMDEAPSHGDRIILMSILAGG
ncbi:MAG TPA: MoaD/ThiS family protein [Anaerolineae bacterium]|nr:MoaD/ThiS family protein [Anaerolineae bacterium]HQH39303.1 MoaD/ThiS family protein [Anaerolineae bacterium]